MVSSPRLCASPGGRLPEALFMVFLLGSKGAKMCKSCRSREELSNEYLLPKFSVDTAENGPLKVCNKIAKRQKQVRQNKRETPSARGERTTSTTTPSRTSTMLPLPTERNTQATRASYTILYNFLLFGGRRRNGAAVSSRYAKEETAQTAKDTNE